MEQGASLGPVTLRRAHRDRADPEGLLLQSNVDTGRTQSATTMGPRTRAVSRAHGPSGAPTTAGHDAVGGLKTAPTYRMEPDPSTAFQARRVEAVAREVLVERLQTQAYDPSTCKQLSQELAGAIMDSLKALPVRGFKMVAVVSLGSVNERPGLQFGSRCLWDQATDSFASVKFTNGSLFAVAMIYGLYYE